MVHDRQGAEGEEGVSYSKGEITMKSKTILIAYQDDLWARSLSTFFHGIGYRVETAKMVSEMIRKVRNG